LLQLLLIANVAPGSLILLTLMMEALHTSKTSVPTRATQRHIPENDILHSHYLENIKSFKVNHVLSVGFLANKAYSDGFGSP
jgi:hypothetical protein